MRLLAQLLSAALTQLDSALTRLLWRSSPPHRSDQVLDAEDACGLLMAEAAQANDDCALVLFCGCDQVMSFSVRCPRASPRRAAGRAGIGTRPWHPIAA